MENVFYYLVFPGFVFTGIAGLLVTWVDRKVTARVHWRKGPPLLQPFWDMIKLLGKEITIPETAKKTGFLLAPLFGLAAITLASTILWMSAVFPQKSFSGDLIVIIYLLTIPAISMIYGGSASGNPFSSVGASREMKLMLAYDLPLLIAIFAVIWRTGMKLSFGEIAAYQQNPAGGTILYTISGVILFIVALMCIQGKLAFVPFDAPEAETEIVEGSALEYSGAALAIIKLTKAMLYFTLPVYVVILFWGGFNFAGIGSGVLSILKVVAVIVLIILIKNTNPRLPIKKVMRFFWGPITILAVIGLILSMNGL
jgi:NADH-quinone oxidoreductase subunit H